MSASPVTARVRRWISGKHGVYGHAEILSPDAPTDSAIYSVKTLGVQPEPDEEFICEIAFSGQRWRVVKLVFDDLPEVIERMRGRVGESSGHGAKRCLSVIPDPAAGTGILRVVIPSSVLGEAGIYAIPAGVVATFDARRVGNEFQATKLHSPQLVEWVAALQRDVGPGELLDCIAFPVNPWPAGSNRNASLALAIGWPGAPLSALVWLRPAPLRALGVRRLFRADLPCTDSVDASRARLEAWSKVLRSGNEDAIDELRIDRLRVHVEAVRDNVALSIKRVLEPGSIREPGAVPEVVEWVAGTVRSIKPASRSASERLEVRIYFDDERLGRSTKSIRLDSTAVIAGGLAPGVPVVIRVESRSIYWNITRIHRSTPHLATPDDAQTMDE